MHKALETRQEISPTGRRQPGKAGASGSPTVPQRTAQPLLSTVVTPGSLAPVHAPWEGQASASWSSPLLTRRASPHGGRWRQGAGPLAPAPVFMACEFRNSLNNHLLNTAVEKAPERNLQEKRDLALALGKGMISGARGRGRRTESPVWGAHRRGHRRGASSKAPPSVRLGGLGSDSDLTAVGPRCDFGAGSLPQFPYL